jgi:hypothetical protein
MVITYTAPGPHVEVFTGQNFTGRRGWLPPGTNRLSALTGQGIANNSISSVRVPEGWRAALYNVDPPWNADSELLITSDQGDLDSLDFDNKTSSIIVEDSAFDQDSDEDGLPDFYENQLYDHPTANTDGTDDFDEDGLTDFHEFLNYGHPTDGGNFNSDFDNDGFADVDEIRWQSAFNDSDSIPQIPGLVAYYSFNEGSGVKAHDHAVLNGEQDAEQEQGTVDWTSTGLIWRSARSKRQRFASGGRSPPQ